MKQGVCAVACGVIAGLVVAFVVPLGGESVPTSAISPHMSNFSDDDGARPSIAASRPTTGGARTENAVELGEKDAGEEGQPDEEQMFAIVQDLLTRRDGALLYKSETELNALSLPDSPVRAADNEMLQELDSVTIIKLHTELRGVKVLERDALDAESVIDPIEEVATNAVGAEPTHTQPGVIPNELVSVEVTTVQELLEVEGQGTVGPLEERCARWLLAPNPWRLYDVLECTG